MVGGSWLSPDGDFRQYGTSKAIPTTAGDFQSPGETRTIEFTVTFADYVPAGQYVIANTTMFPSGVFTEQVEMDVEVAAAGGTSFSIGTCRMDRTTTGSAGTAAGSFINGEVLATVTPAGKKVIYTAGTSGAGSLIGATSSFTDGSAYLTITTVGTFTGGGRAKIRIKYRGIGTITF
jgi:hypothetical protein